MSPLLTLRTDAGDEPLDFVELEARARRGELPPRSFVRFPPLTGECFVPAEELTLLRSLHEPRHAHFRRTFGVGRFPWLTFGLVAANLLAYFTSASGGPIGIDTLVRFGGKVGPLVTDLGEVWRVLTANFLHSNALHLGVNMFVLFSVGALLENIFRALDYLWLIVASAVATMGLSLLFSDAISVGASGIVFGCLGALAAFGIRYRPILPERYRRVIGEAALPTVIGLFLVGFTSAGSVDNWAHLGGLLAGGTTALFMRPRLLVRAPPVGWSRVAPLVPTAAILLLLVVAQAALDPFLPLVRTERDDAFGISVPVPVHWRRGANRMGQLAFYNGLPGLGRATFAADAVESEDALEQAQRFVEEVLSPTLVTQQLKASHVEPLGRLRLAQRDAFRIRARLDEPLGQSVLEAYFVSRGELVYQLVFTYPVGFPGYARVVERMLSGLTFVEPRDLRQARAAVLLFPQATSALANLGRQLRRDGQHLRAAEALQKAVSRAPDAADARAELALALLQAGRADEGCEAVDAALAYAPRDARALEVAARCELSRGNPQAALERLDAALSSAPDDERLRRAETKLREAIGRP